MYYAIVKGKTILICFSIALERIQKICDKQMNKTTTKKDCLKLETVHVHIFSFIQKRQFLNFNEEIKKVFPFFKSYFPL